MQKEENKPTLHPSRKDSPYLKEGHKPKKENTHKEKKNIKKNFPYPKENPHWGYEESENGVVFAQCKICETGISNENYAIKVNDTQYIHFECALKKVKEIAMNSFSYGNKMKYSYVGSNTFAIYLEQGGSVFSWKILQKIKVEEFLPSNRE